MAKSTSPHFLRRTFLTGLLILLPLFVTYLLITFLFNLFASAGAPFVKGLSRVVGLNYYAWVQPLESLVNLLLSLGVIFVLGLVGTNILGRRIITAVEVLLLRVPVVKTIYGAVKQMVDTFQRPGGSFQRVVLLQYPSKGLWVIGFVAAERRDTVTRASADTLLAVFVPTTPNPTSGFLVLVSPEDVVDVDYSVEEAFTFIVSSGIVGKDLAAASLGAAKPQVHQQATSEPSGRCGW